MRNLRFAGHVGCLHMQIFVDIYPKLRTVTPRLHGSITLSRICRCYSLSRLCNQKKRYVKMTQRLSQNLFSNSFIFPC